MYSELDASYHPKNERVKENFIFLLADKNWAQIWKWIASKHRDIKKVNSIYHKNNFLRKITLKFKIIQS